MRPLGITAVTVVSAIGRGVEATGEALVARRSGLRACDFAEVTLGGHIGRVEGLEQHALPAHLAAYDCRNNRLADLALRTDGFDGQVAEAVARFGAGRIAVILGTSTSGVLSSEEAYLWRDAQGALPAAYDFEHTHDLFSLARFVQLALGLAGPAMVVSTACASSAKTFIDAHHLISSGLCDAAVVGGADSLCRMTLHGFKALDLISDEPCRPCDVARAGISIGEAAGFALVTGEAPRGGMALLGYGATSDGYHMSTPHPQGAGAIGAMREALRRAGLAADDIDYVNLHGTGTRANDATEDLAVAAVFGNGTPCSSTKAWTGHTLGTSGVLEAAIAALCVRHEFMPGCLNVCEIDPEFQAHVLDRNESGNVRRVVSNSFGFGGINCSLVLGRAG